MTMDSIQKMTTASLTPPKPQDTSETNELPSNDVPRKPSEPNGGDFQGRGDDRGLKGDGVPAKTRDTHRDHAVGFYAVENEYSPFDQILNEASEWIEELTSLREDLQRTTVSLETKNVTSLHSWIYVITRSKSYKKEAKNLVDHRLGNRSRSLSGNFLI